MTWWQFSLCCDAAEIDSVEAVMLELGALSISLGDAGDEPIYEPLPGSTPLWQRSVLTATFDAGLDPDDLWQRLSAALPPHLESGLRRGGLEDRDWVEAYKQHFSPLQCAPGLWIVPSWCEPPDPQAVNIRLDPGLAFGTGTHPTTFLCLAWLARHQPSGSSVIDYGCGSGILAIAACRLGAGAVRAVDIDPQALAASRANLAANGIEPELLRLSTPDAMEKSQADLLVANILAGPLLDLAVEFAGLVTAGGRILLSGILKTQLDTIQSAYRPYFEFDPANEREDWVCLSGTRNSTAVNV